jgi:hypothetical protein
VQTLILYITRIKIYICLYYRYAARYGCASTRASKRNSVELTRNAQVDNTNTVILGSRPGHELGLTSSPTLVLVLAALGSARCDFWITTGT